MSNDDEKLRSLIRDEFAKKPGRYRRIAEVETEINRLYDKIKNDPPATKEDLQKELEKMSSEAAGTDENVIYEAPTPPYVVQEAVDYFRFGDPGTTWLDIKGFQSATHARAYADDEKRRNPATDYRVVKTGEAG